MIGILERENAAILNESLKELATVTIKSFGDALQKLKIKCPFYLTQNDGTLIRLESSACYRVMASSSFLVIKVYKILSLLIKEYGIQLLYSTQT